MCDAYTFFHFSIVFEDLEPCNLKILGIRIPRHSVKSTDAVCVLLRQFGGTLANIKQPIPFQNKFGQVRIDEEPAKPSPCMPSCFIQPMMLIQRLP